jgi:hypothetical protein
MEGKMLLQNDDDHKQLELEAEKLTHLIWALKRQYKKYPAVDLINLIRKYTKPFNDMYEAHQQADYYCRLHDIQSLENRREANGISLQGIFNVSYDNVLWVMQKHNIRRWWGSDDNKTDVHWYGKFQDGRVFSIYNWKDGISYLGLEGLEVQQIRSWHIAGRDDSVVDDLTTLFEIDLGRTLVRDPNNGYGNIICKTWRENND